MKSRDAEVTASVLVKVKVGAKAGSFAGSESNLDDYLFGRRNHEETGSFEEIRSLSH